MWCCVATSLIDEEKKIDVAFSDIDETDEKAYKTASITDGEIGIVSEKWISDNLHTHDLATCELLCSELCANLKELVIRPFTCFSKLY